MKKFNYSKTVLNISAIYIPFVTFGSIALLLTGCQTTSNNYPTLSLEQADAYRQQLIKEHQQYLKFLSSVKSTFVQPANKTEACLLPNDSEFVKLPGFKTYWDGDCRNGYAYGLGREIETTGSGIRLDEISVYSENVNNSGPIVQIDYQKGSIFKGILEEENYTDRKDIMGGKLFGVRTQLEPWPGHAGYKTAYVAFVYETATESADFVQRPTSLNTVSLRRKDGVGYRMTDFSAQPQKDLDPPLYAFSIISPTGKVGGVGGQKYASGRLVAVDNSGLKRQFVNVPSSYFNPINAAIKEVEPLAIKARDAQEPAERMWRQYLSKVCNNPNVSVPKGLSKSQYLEVCSMEKNMVAEVNKSVAVAKQEFETAKREAAVQLAEKQRNLREQQEHQARMRAYRAQTAAAWAAVDATRENTDAIRDNTSAIINHTNFMKSLIW